MYVCGFRGYGRQNFELETLGIETRIPNRLFATVVVGWFLLTVLGMAMRQALGVKLGFSGMTGVVMLVLLMEVLGPRVKAPSFESVMGELDWRTILLHVSLFVLVGEYPAEAILKTASKRKCDLIVMASHGRGGLAAVLLRSESQKVLMQSKVPVLVHRQARLPGASKKEPRWP